jgi:hypothetical protein
MSRNPGYASHPRRGRSGYIDTVKMYPKQKVNHSLETLRPASDPSHCSVNMLCGHPVRREIDDIVAPAFVDTDRLTLSHPRSQSQIPGRQYVTDNVSSKIRTIGTTLRSSVATTYALGLTATFSNNLPTCSRTPCKNIVRKVSHTP